MSSKYWFALEYGYRYVLGIYMCIYMLIYPSTIYRRYSGVKASDLKRYFIYSWGLRVIWTPVLIKFLS